MDVRCERCQSEYEFEDARIPDTGLSVKCSSCGHIFRVTKPGNQEIPVLAPAPIAPAPVLPAPQAPTSHAPAGLDWMVRQQNGNVFSFRELTTLQRWIVERKVSREDQISKTAKNWKRLGDIAELSAFFQVVDAQMLAPMAIPGMMPAGSVPQGPQLQPVVPQAVPGSAYPAGYPQPGAWPAVVPGAMPNYAVPGQVWDPAAQAPAGWAQVPVPPPKAAPRPIPVMGSDTPTIETVGDSTEDFPKKRRKGLWIALGLLVFLGGGIGGTYLVRPALFKNLLGGVNELAVRHIQSGYLALARDSRAALEQAVSDFSKAISIDASASMAHAGLAEAETTIAENLIDEADALTTQRSALPEPEQAKLTGDIEAKRREASERSERAFNAAKQSLELAADSVPGLRAMADYYRFKKALDKARPLLERAKTLSPTDARVAYVQGSSVMSDPTTWDRALRHFDEALELDRTLVRARYKTARVLGLQGNKDKAIEQLQALLREVPDHERAQALLKELTPPPPVAEPTPSAAPEPPPEPKKPTFDQLLNQAERLRDNDKASRALKLYEQALELEPEDPDAATGMAWCYLDMDQPDAAIATFKQVLSKAPRLSDAHMGIAEAYRQKGSKRDAVKHYKAYLDIMPNGPDAEVAKRMLKDLGQ